MKRSAAKWICAVSGIVFLGLSVILVHAAIEAMNTPATGIIGGADLPTLGFLLEQILRTPVGIAAVAAFLLFCSSGLTLLCGKKSP